MGLDAGMYLIFNVMDSLHICTLGETNKQALRAIAFGMTPAGNMIYPTCHAFTQVSPRDGYDLLIGLSTGDVVVASVHQQLMASSNNTKVVGMLRFNIDSEVDSTRVVGADWVPCQNGQFFVVGHLSGRVYLYNKASAMMEDDQSETGSSSPGRMPMSVFDISRKGLNALAAAPDGTRLATAARDGVVRIHDLTNGALLASFRVYYGNPTCCAWSADGACVAAGGEDDLVTVYSVMEQRVVAWCEGHTSWVTTVCFDPWSTSSTEMEVDSSTASAPAQEEEASPPGITYRVASLAQDCHICMWDLTIPDSPSLQPHTRELEQVAPQPCPEPHRAHSSAAGMMNGSLKSLGRLGSLGSSPSRGSPTSYHIRNSSSASSLSLAPEAIPVTPRKDMKFLPCVASSRIHVEPGSDILFMQKLMFTACYGGQVKGWERLKPQPIPPEPPTPTQGPQSPSVLAAPQHSTPRAAAIAAASVQEEGVRDQHRRLSQEGAPPRQRAPTSPAAIVRTPQLSHARSEQETGAAQSAAALHH